MSKTSSRAKGYQWLGGDEKESLVIAASDLIRTLMKRAQVVDEELRLLRQLIQYQSSLSHREYLDLRRGEFPLDTPFVRDDAARVARAKRRPFSEPRPLLFESLMEVTQLIAQEFECLRGDLIGLNHDLVRDIENRYTLFDPDKVFWPLSQYANAFRGILSAFNSAQLYFIQRTEQTSPAQVSIPRMFKRENEKTISLIENTYRAYRESVGAFLGTLISDDAKRADAMAVQSALSFDHGWSPHVIAPKPSAVAHLRLFERAQGMDAHYALIGGASVLLELPRFLPLLAHEAAHLMLLRAQSHKETQWEYLAKDCADILLRMRAQLERLFAAETDILDRATNAADAHMNELMADFVALCVAGPTYVSAYFQSEAAGRHLVPRLDDDVPFRVRLAVLLDVFEYLVFPDVEHERRRAALDERRQSRPSWLSRATFRADVFSGFRWWNRSNFDEVLAFLNYIPNASFQHPGFHRQKMFVESYARIASRGMRELVDVCRLRGALRHAIMPRSVADGGVLEPIIAKLAGSPYGDLVNSEGGRRATRAFLPSAAGSSRGDAMEDLNARVASLDRLIVHLVGCGHADQVAELGRARDAATKGGIAKYAKWTELHWQKPVELRLFHALHTAKFECLADMQGRRSPGSTWLRTNTTEAASLVRIHSYMAHWNESEPLSPTLLCTNPPRYPFAMAIKHDEHERGADRLRVAKYVAFGEADVVVLTTRCDANDHPQEYRDGVLGGTRRQWLDWRSHAQRPKPLVSQSFFEDRHPEGAESLGTVNNVFLRQRDYDDVTALFVRVAASPDLRTLTSRLVAAPLVVASHVRFLRRSQMGRALLQDEGAELSLTDQLVEKILLVGGVTIRAVLRGHGWEDVVILWEPNDPLVLKNVLQSVFSQYFGTVQNLQAEQSPRPSVERVITSVLVGDNALWRYAREVDRVIYKHGRKELTIEGKSTTGLTLGEWLGLRVRVATWLDRRPNPPTLRDFPTTVERLRPDLRGSAAAALQNERTRVVELRGSQSREPIVLKSFCTLRHSGPTGSSEYIHDMQRLINQAFVNAGDYSRVAAYQVTGSVDVILKWSFDARASLTFIYFVVAAALSHLINTGCLLGCSTAFAIPYPDRQGPDEVIQGGRDVAG